MGSRHRSAVALQNAHLPRRKPVACARQVFTSGHALLQPGTAGYPDLATRTTCRSVRVGTSSTTSLGRAVMLRLYHALPGLSTGSWHTRERDYRAGRERHHPGVIRVILSRTAGGSVRYASRRTDSARLVGRIAATVRSRSTSSRADSVAAVLDPNTDSGLHVVSHPHVRLPVFAHAVLHRERCKAAREDVVAIIRELHREPRRPIGDRS